MSVLGAVGHIYMAIMVNIHLASTIKDNGPMHSCPYRTSCNSHP